MKRFSMRVLSMAMCLVMLFSLAGLQVIGFAAQGAEPFRVSVCINGDASDSRGFCWYTYDETDTKVSVFAAGVDVTSSLAVSGVTCEQWEGAYMHKAVVSGLDAGTQYTFKVGNGTVWSDEGTFVTDDGDSSFSFITIADVQASNEENFRKGAATLSAAFDTVEDAEFVVNCGDFTNDSTNEEWNLYDQEFKALNAAATIVPVAGNHDGLGVEDWFKNMFALDMSESVQTKNGVNYSFDYGNAHIAVLNTNDTLAISTAQLTWLKNDMNGTDKDWKIVFMHKSPYTLGKDGKWPDALYLQDSLTSVLDKCNVDLVMSGHDHMYLRTKPLTGNKLNDSGVTYVLSGTAGSKRYEVRSFLADSFLKTDFIDAMVVQKGGYGNYWDGESWENTSATNIGGCFNGISIDGGTLTLNSYILCDETGEITNTDTYTVSKTTGQNKITFTGDNTTSAAQYNLNLVPSYMCLAAYAFCKWLPKFLIMLPKLLDVVINEGTF